MRQVAEIKPLTPTSSKPIAPWAAATATAIFIFLIIGIGSQYLTRFQEPYNVNAQSETTVEIVDAPFVLDTQAKPDLRNQAGRFETDGKRSSIGPQASEPVVLAAVMEANHQKSTAIKQQWMQASGPEGVSISDFFASSKGDVYATSPIGIYRLTPDAKAWTLVNASVTNGRLYSMPMAERDGTLYIVSVKEVLSSTDCGKTWNILGSRPKGKAIGLIITDYAFHLAVKKGIYQSKDSGKQWTAFNDGFTFNEASTDEEISAVTSIGNTVFAATNRGLYRLNSGTWKKFPIKTRNAFDDFDSLAVSENNLYVAASPDFSQMMKSPEAKEAYYTKSITSNEVQWSIFHSTDLGNTWAEITPKNVPFSMQASRDIKLLVAGETLLALTDMNGIRSKDGGKTWTDLGKSYTHGYTPAVAVNENIIYAGEIRRTTDAGKSWEPFMKGTIGTGMRNLVAFKNGLYVHNNSKIVKSMDSGESWAPVNFRKGRGSPRDPDFPNQRLVIADGIPYGVSLEEKKRKLSIFEIIFGSSSYKRKSKMRIFHLSTDSNTLSPVRGLPALEFDDDLYTKDLLANEMTLGELAVSNDTFYIEYRRELFKCEPGAQKWTSTGLIDIEKQPRNNRKGFQLAVSGETVYVGKRDGKLFQSLDGGNTWKDLTTNLPLHFERFNQIAFAGSTVYVATDSGVLVSENGEHWRVIVDKSGIHTLIERIAVDAATVYGAGEEGVYRLNNHEAWEKISPEAPNSVKSLAIKDDKLYITTKHRGMFHISVEKE